MADISELELRNRELEPKRHELELELSKLSIEFGNYGFHCDPHPEIHQRLHRHSQGY